MSDTIVADTNYFKTFSVFDKFYKIELSLVSSGIIQLETRLCTNTPEDQESYYEKSENSMYDAFTKLRVSNPFSLLEIKFPSQSVGTPEFLSNNLLVCSESSGSYSAVYGASKALISGSGTGYFISQSRQYTLYQPGKSQLFLGSGVLKNMGTGGTSGSPDHSAYIGIFDNNNGLFFVCDSVNGVGVGLRKATVDTMVLQSNWNIDPMNGTGKSGLNLDFTKTQLFVIDFEWLGVGRIRFGFYAFGQIFYCHQILNLNQLVEPYMVGCNLPVRYQLVGRNATGTTAQLTQICSTVISEGGYNPQGRPFVAARTSSVTIPNKTEGFVLAIRFKSTAYHENVIPVSSSIITTSNDVMLYRFRLYQAPNSPGTLNNWQSADPNSVIEYSDSISGTLSKTGSVIVDEGYVVGKEISSTVGFGTIFKLIQMTANISNTSDIFVLSVDNLSQNNNPVYGTIAWQEGY